MTVAPAEGSKATARRLGTRLSVQLWRSFQEDRRWSYLSKCAPKLLRRALSLGARKYRIFRRTPAYRPAAARGTPALRRSTGSAARAREAHDAAIPARVDAPRSSPP